MKRMNAIAKHRNWRFVLALMGTVMLAPAAVFSADAGSNMLQDIEVLSLPGQQVQLVLKLSDPAPEPLSFTIDNPARISLDLADTAIALPSRRKDVGVGALRAVLAAEASGRTRVVLNLDSMVPYETRVEGNNIYVTLGEGTIAASASGFGAQSGSTSAPTRPAAVSSGVRSITQIDFRRTETGAGRIIVGLNDPSTLVDIREEGGRVVAEFKNTEIPASLMQRLDVIDFATPVSTIDATRSGPNAIVAISAAGDYEQLAYQSDEVFTVEVAPRSEEPETIEDLEEKVYTGERLTLNFQDIEVRAVLQLLADTSGLNIVVSDTVQGNVTLRLQNVPWDQALDIVLQTKGLDMRQNENVIIVAPAEEIAARERAELEARQAIEELAPLRSEFLQVNYAKASELAGLIGSQGGGNSLLSERGSVTIDERTNTLLLQDTSDKLAEIRRLVRRLDIPVRQVLIEARIVIANDDFSRDLGVKFGITGVDEVGDGLLVATGSASDGGTDTMIGSALENLDGSGQPFPIALPGINDRLNVNLPTTSPAGRIALAFLDSDYLIDLELSALENEGRGEVVSSPRVTTANQKTASIEQGVEIPYQEASSSGATSVSFKEAVLRLQVTPQITPDDRIIMDLLINKDSVGQQVPTIGGFVPSIDTNQVETQVLVENGETIVLGGIYETTTSETRSKVPFLGDIPGLGHLFRSTQRESNKAELLIFVTPKILTDGGFN